jgi:transcription elongation GreA/GreB family factor
MDKTLIIEKIVNGIDTEATMTADEVEREEILSEKELYENISLEDNSGKVQIGSVVKLNFNGKINAYFIAPSGMGNIMKVGDTAVVVISVFSTLGDAVLHAEVGQEVTIKMRGQDRLYKVEEII